MFKILIISVITFMIVIIIFLIFMSFLNVDIKTTSKTIEKFVVQEPTFSGGAVKKTDYIIFTSDGTISFNNETICEVLIVGGGGGGARNDDWEGGGGGGGGGVGYGLIIFNNGTYNIKIGSGGEGGGINNRVENGKDGGNTTIIGGVIDETSYGGGGGGYKPGLDGGSGGGGSGHSGFYSGGIAKKGNSSSDIFKVNMTYYGNNGGYGNNQSGGSGGGGAGSQGVATGIYNYNGGNGGDGKEFSITGDKIYYGGGGGGASGCHGGCNKANGTNSGNGGLGGGGRGGDRNNPTNGEANTGGGGGGSSKSNGAKGGSGIVIIRYRNISDIQPISKEITNLFSNKRPWGMYFADDFDGIYLNDKTSNERHASISGNMSKSTSNGNGANGSITYIKGGTSSIITWPSGSIPSQFTILSLTRYAGNSRGRILTSSGGNWLHGHWNGKRGMCYYEGWKKYEPSIGNLDDWLCCIGKNGGSTPNNILIDGIPYGQSGGGNGGQAYNLCINCFLPWDRGASSSEPSDWALSCVIIWNTHLSDDEMQLLNKLINYYKKTGKPLIDIINNNVNNNININNNQTQKQLTKDELYNSNNQAFYYIEKFNNLLTYNYNNIREIRKNDILLDNSLYNNLTIFNNNRFNNGSFNINGISGEKIRLIFNTSFVLKKIIFTASERRNAPAAWIIILGGNNTLSLSGTATSQDYDEIEGKSNDNCVKFYIDNTTSTDTYDIIFTKTLGGTQLNFNRMILFEGIRPDNVSTAGESIDGGIASLTMVPRN